MGIFKGKINVQKAVDTVFSGIDKSILSKEELVDYSIKAIELDLEFIKLANQESTPRSISRRVIAILVIGQYMLAFNVGMLGIATGWFDGKEILTQATNAFEWSVISIIIFYFGNHLLNSVIPKFGNKKKS